MDHLSDFSWCYVFLQLLGNGHQVFRRDKSVVVFINVIKYSLDIFLCIFLTGFDSHHVHEFLEGDLTSVISIELTHRHVNECSSGFVPSILTDSLSKIKRCKHTVIIGIKIVKDLLKHINIPFAAFSC